MTCVVIACGVALSRTAAASAPDAADRAFDEGVAYMKAGRHDEACPLVAQSYRLDPLPGTLFTLAECEALRGRFATASRLYGEFLELVLALPAGKRARYLRRTHIAEAQRIALGPKIPELTLRLSGAPPGTVVDRDGDRIAATAIGVPSALDPGDHEVIAQAPGEPSTRVVVHLAPGEKQTITIEVKAPSIDARPPLAPRLIATSPARVAPSPAIGARRVVTYAVAGIGATGLIVGAVFGAMAIEQAGVIHRECSGSACTRTGKEAADALARTGVASTVGFGVGLAGAGAAVLLRLTEPAKRADPGVRVGVIAKGAGLAIEGAW